MLEKLNVIIYAAGVARRLQTVLGGKHKGLLPLGEKTIIEHQLDWICSLNVENLVIVLGKEHQDFLSHLGSTYNGHKINYVFNEDYKTKGNMLSLWAAREFCNQNVLFTTSDLFCDPQNMKEFIRGKEESKILIDQNKKLYSDPDPVKVKIDESGKIVRLHKNLKLEDVNGLAIGVYQFSKQNIGQIINKIEKKISTGEDNLSLYRPIDEIINSMNVKPVFCKSSVWVDIDTPEDLETAKNYFKLTKDKGLKK